MLGEVYMHVDVSLFGRVTYSVFHVHGVALLRELRLVASSSLDRRYKTELH